MNYREYVAVSITADAEQPAQVELADAQRADAINTFAVDYNTEPFIVTVGPGEAGNLYSFYLDALVAGESVLTADGCTVTINWGDGVQEIADASDPQEEHEYDAPGTYDVDVLLEREGQPSLARRVSITAPQAAVPLGADVPDGTIDDVKAWVGDDPDRAQQALDAEEAGQQRVTLIDWLEGVIG